MEFDAAITHLLNEAYEGSDFRARRKANIDALRLREGEVIVDIGAGAGHLAEELGRAGATVVGVDPSEAMLEQARARCAGRENVSFHQGSAEALPLEDGTADAVVSIQVFEYLPDIPTALQEAARVLRPGGRLVIGDLHFGSLIWATDDPDRAARVFEIYDRHFATGLAPEILRTALPAAGFGQPEISTLTTTDIDLRPDGLAAMMLRLIPAFVRSQGPDAGALAEAWQAEQQARARENRFFFSLSHFVLRAVRE